MATRIGMAKDFLIGPRLARPDRRVDVYLLLGATFAAVLTYVVALLFNLHPPRGLTVAFFAATPICATFALVVLENRARATSDLRLGWVSAGLAVGIVAMLLQVISFPAVTPRGGVLGTGDDSSAALYLLFHASLAAGATAGALGAAPRWRVPAVLGGLVLAVLLALDLVPLPELIRDGTYFTPLLVALELVLAAFIATATTMWVLRVGRAAAAPHGWIGVALSLSLYDALLNAAGAERYEAVWWASLSLRVATYLVLGLGALFAVLRQLRDSESYSESELSRREAQLRDSLSVTVDLLSSAEDLSRAVTSEQVADQLSAKARAASVAPYASVVVGRRGEPLRLVGADGYTTQMRAQLTQVDWDMLLPAPHVLAVGEPVFLESAAEIQRRFPRTTGCPMGRSAALAALAALPIKVGPDVIGVLSVWDQKPRPWNTNQRRVLAGLAAQGGQAIARARAYEEQAAAARTLQASLLPPRLPQPARLDLAARYVPAEDGVLVGGDWYDCLVLDDGRVALVVGDVMGKGLHAAAQMGQIRTAVRSAAQLDPSPSAVLTALDEVNLELGDDEIATLAYVLVDPVRGMARVARAGHLPPLLAHPHGAVQPIEAGGSAPLGAAFGATRTESTFSLPVGSLLVLYTDGLVEDRLTGLERGLPELTKTLSDVASSSEPTGDLAARLLEECTIDPGRDDIALLLARYC